MSQSPDSGPTAGQSLGRVLLGVTGGIAAYKACEVASRLTQSGYEVRVVMTRAAREFVGPLTFAALTGNPVSGEMFDPGQEAAISHIDLARWAQVVAVAPATADFLAKAANGMADDLLSTLLLASNAPFLLAPAMNPAMFAHPAVQKNLATLIERGALVVGPAQGRTACGEEGPGRMIEPAEITAAVRDVLAPARLAGVKLVVSAGPTREHWDPVRFISNPSTGRMGIEVARAAVAAGADVVLVLGPTHLEPPAGARTVRVTSASDMHRVIVAEAADARAVVMAAAVSDFAPAECAPQKAKKEAVDSSECPLVRTPDILAELGQNKGDRVLVGFAAETEELLANAQGKLMRKNLDLMVANDVSAKDAGFAVTTNRVHFITPDGAVDSLPLLSKAEVARRLCVRLADLLK